LEVLSIEPFGFFEVELGTGTGAVGQVEFLDEFVEGEEFAVVSGVPPE
jgi:hypothetical protein